MGTEIVYQYVQTVMPVIMSMKFALKLAAFQC